MKLVILTVGSLGDVRPYVALGKGLLAAGIETTIATHAEFEALVRGAGLGFHLLRGNPRELIQSMEGQALLKSGRSILNFAQSMREAAGQDFDRIADDCLEASRDADALMLTFLTAGLGIMIARSRQRDKRPLKTIVAYLQPLTPTGAFPTMTLPTMYFGGLINRATHQLTRQIFWQVFQPLLTDWSQKRLGLKPGGMNAFGWLEKRSLVLYGYSRFLVPRPGDWPKNIHVTGPWLLEAGDYAPPPELRAFLEAGAKPLYVGFGSMASDDPERLTSWVLEALQASGQRGILHRGWGGLQGEAPSDQVFLVDQVPHDWLFAQTRGVVHHGGAGTTQAGLWAGVPGLGIPFFGDQAFWSQRLFGMGCGPRPVSQRKLSQKTLSESFKALSDQPRYTRRAAEFAQRMRSEGGVREAATRVKKFLV